MNRHEVKEHLASLEEQMKSLWEAASEPDDDGCTRGEVIAIAEAYRALKDLKKGLDEGVDVVYSKLPVEVPLGLTYHEARMRVIHQFQLLYCSSMVAKHGSINEAAKAANFEKSNFRRVLRQAREFLAK